MCGIAGASLSSLNEFDKKIHLAIRSLAHRGPNDSGVSTFGNEALRFVVLGHTRLSVIDLSVAGHQPMTSQDGRYHLIFNGEIYNYKELRNELSKIGYNFKSNTDTEVLLASWIMWGRESLSKLVGMFSFVVFDKDANKLFIARDAFGIKPLYYYQHSDGSIYFASEIPALLKIIPVKVQLNWQRSYDYLIFGDYDNNEETFFSGIKHVQPATYIVYDVKAGNIEEKTRWWVPNVRQSSILSMEEACEQFREIFLKNLKLHLRSDVPVGVALSGGLDSSAIVSGIRQIDPRLELNTFSYISSFADRSEEKWVDLVNKKVNARPCKIYASAHNLHVDLDKLIKLQGEPFGGTSIYAQYRVFEKVKDSGIVVTLDGQGADELLAGYNGFPGQVLVGFLVNGQVGKAVDYLSKWSGGNRKSIIRAISLMLAHIAPDKFHKIGRRLVGRDQSSGWLDLKKLDSYGVHLGYKKARHLLPLSRPLTSQLASMLHERELPALLRHADRNSMHFSIESRVPFLNTELAEFLFSLPERYFVSSDASSKNILRVALKDIVPSEILSRKDKIGFETPEKDWLLSISSIVRAWLVENQEIPFLDQKILLSEFDLVIKGKKPYTLQVWRWINFIRWHRYFIHGIDD